MDETPANANLDPITAFHREYAQAIGAARLTAETTATPGWIALYGAEQEVARRARRQLAVSLRESADALEDAGLEEEGIKEIKDIAKGAEELRQRAAHFERIVAGAIAAPALECERIIVNHQAKAAREEAASPLLNAGLVEMMRIAVARVSRARWDAETGRVIITDGKAAGEEAA